MTRRIWTTFVSTAMVVLNVAAAEAQVLGVKGGVNLSTIKYGADFEIQTTAKPGVTAGVFVRLSPAKILSLQIEGLLTQRVVDFEGIIKDTLTYVEVPVLLRYPLLTTPTLRVRAHGGASFGILLMAKERVAGETADIKEAFAPWDVAVTAGAEVELKDRWVFDVRYVFAVTDLYHADVAVDFPGKQRAIQITAGYRFK